MQDSKNFEKVGQFCNENDGKLQCYYYKHPRVCIEKCLVFVHYVMPNNETMTRQNIYNGKQMLKWYIQRIL